MNASQQQPKPSNHDVEATLPSSATTTDAALAGPNHQSHILIDNPKKSNNLGPILRCAAAFAASKVVLIGYDKCSTDGSHGAAKHVPTISFPTFDQGVEYLKKDCGVVSVIGLLGCYEEGNDNNNNSMEEEDEIVVAGLIKDDDLVVAMNKNDIRCDDKGTKRFFCSKQQQQQYTKSWPVHKRLFAKEGNTSFIISKNWRGLPLEHATHCDAFVHIPLHSAIQLNGNNNSEHHLSPPEQQIAPFQLLDVQSCLSITLHHYTAWAKYHERSFDGQKFEVIKKDITTTNTNINERQVESARKRARLREEAVENGSSCYMDGGIFGGDTHISADY